MKKLELVTSKREDILCLARKHGAERIRLFGSSARSQDSETSDIDLLVKMEPGRSLIDSGALLMDMEALLGCRVDLVSENGLRPRFRERIEADAVAL
ncbi:MAG: nucleotidyltransferase family protein [Blastochloris sp.]|nr:nucleotidyltransferase family protein [Blastochloris sp.]